MTATRRKNIAGYVPQCRVQRDECCQTLGLERSGRCIHEANSKQGATARGLHWNPRKICIKAPIGWYEKRAVIT